MSSATRVCSVDQCECVAFDPNPFAPAKCKCQHYEKDHASSATKQKPLSKDLTKSVTPNTVITPQTPRSFATTSTTNTSDAKAPHSFRSTTSTNALPSSQTSEKQPIASSALSPRPTTTVLAPSTSSYRSTTGVNTTKPSSSSSSSSTTSSSASSPSSTTEPTQAPLTTPRGTIAARSDRSNITTNADTSKPSSSTTTTTTSTTTPSSTSSSPATNIHSPTKSSSEEHITQTTSPSAVQKFGSQKLQTPVITTTSPSQQSTATIATRLQRSESNSGKTVQFEQRRPSGGASGSNSAAQQSPTTPLSATLNQSDSFSSKSSTPTSLATSFSHKGALSDYPLSSSSAALYSSVLAPAFFENEEMLLQSRQRKISIANPVRASVANLPLGHLIPQGQHHDPRKHRQSLHASVEGDITISSIIKHSLRAAKLNDEQVDVIMNNIQSLKPRDSSLLDRQQLRNLLQILYKVQVLVGQQDLDRALIFMQSTIRMKRERRRYLAFKESETFKRNKIIQNLYIDERKYFSKLRAGFKTYYTELMVLASSTPGVKGLSPTVADIKAVFGNFDIIYSFHQELIGSFEELLNSWPYVECRIGKLFKARAPFLKYYGDYSSNFHFSSETMRRLEEMEKYRNCMQQLDEKVGPIGLQAILSFPLNRVPQYENFLELILQHTPKNHPDHNDLFEVLAIVRQTVPIIQDKLEHSTERAVILDILRRLQKSHSILSEKSRFIREIEVSELRPKPGPRTFFIFNDRLVLSKTQPKGYCKFRQSVSIANLKVKSAPDTPNFKNIVELGGCEIEVISFATPEDKSSWMKQYENLARELAETRTYGASLEAVLKREAGNPIPRILSYSLDFLRKNALDSVGIFRLSGDVADVDFIKRKWDEGGEIDLSNTDINAVAASVKLWFRELPEPVFTHGLYEDLCCFGELPKNEKERIAYLLQIIKRLPQPNYEIIKYLFLFLEEVSSHSSKNRMDAANLSTVFGPNLIKPKEITIENAMDIPRVNEVICFMIEKRTAVFVR